MSCGRPFQKRAAATGKARLPMCTVEYIVQPVSKELERVSQSYSDYGLLTEWTDSWFDVARGWSDDVLPPRHQRQTSTLLQPAPVQLARNRDWTERRATQVRQSSAGRHSSASRRVSISDVQTGMESGINVLVLYFSMSSGLMQGFAFRLPFESHLYFSCLLAVCLCRIRYDTIESLTWTRKLSIRYICRIWS